MSFACPICAGTARLPLRNGFGAAASIARRLASRISSRISSKIVAGLKLGGNERGENSLKVAANLKTSSITPYMLPTWLS